MKTNMARKRETRYYSETPEIFFHQNGNQEIERGNVFLLNQSTDDIQNNYYEENIFYFTTGIGLYVELMIAKMSKIKFSIIQKLKNLTRYKQNYKILLDDFAQNYNSKLNIIMKTLTIIVTVYSSVQAIPQFFGMNIKIPFKEVDNYWPFFGVICSMLGLGAVELWIFKKWNWW